MSSSPSAERRIPMTSPQAARVLIVEDELFVAWHLESLVRDLKYDVCGLVPDGEGAVEQAADLEADLVLMDISLSGEMDGIEAARRIRQDRDTPIIFITAYSDAATLERIKDCRSACAGAGEADFAGTSAHVHRRGPAEASSDS